MDRLKSVFCSRFAGWMREISEWKSKQYSQNYSRELGSMKSRPQPFPSSRRSLTNSPSSSSSSAPPLPLSPLRLDAIGAHHRGHAPVACCKQKMNNSGVGAGRLQQLMVFSLSVCVRDEQRFIPRIRIIILSWNRANEKTLCGESEDTYASPTTRP